MDTNLIQIAQACLDAAEANTMTFPRIVAMLTEAGFESYAVDFRTGTATYYRPDGDSIVLPAHRGAGAVGPVLDTAAIQVAISEAQQLVAGYTYAGFCEKARLAGCAGYLVSFSGRRAVYFGRDGAVHVEEFPQ
jgi:uncharacterized protein YbcV (DUF1398 family)